MLDAIITYAPSALYQNNVGVTIAADHPGREVMRTNTPLVYSGRQVRGDILNSMLPIERNGEILGYIWANELTEDIRRRALENGCEDYHCAHRWFADKPAVDCPFLPSPERQY